MRVVLLLAISLGLAGSSGPTASGSSPRHPAAADLVRPTPAPPVLAASGGRIEGRDLGHPLGELLSPEDDPEVEDKSSVAGLTPLSPDRLPLGLFASVARSPAPDDAGEPAACRLRRSIVIRC